MSWDVEGNKKVEEVIQPTRSELTRGLSKRALKPTIKASESQDKVVKRMFGLATNVRNRKANETTPIMKFMAHLENVNTLFDKSINKCHF